MVKPTGKVFGTMNKPWIDLVTMDIPRGLLRDCLPSFLQAWKDRSQYKIRWLYHLDLPMNERFEDRYITEVYAAYGLLPEFEDIVACFPTEPQGFGRTVCRLLRYLDHDLLWIEDDWDWTGKSFKLAEVIAKTKDCYSFVTPDTSAGAFHPTFYRRYVLDYLREHMPGDLDSFSERTSFRILRGKFEMTGETLLTLADNHLGHKRMKELGFTHNWCGQNLSHQRLHRPSWDSKKRQWVQQE